MSTSLSSWEARPDGAFSPVDDDVPVPEALINHLWRSHNFYNVGDLERANTKLQVMRHEHYLRHAESLADHSHEGDELWAFGSQLPTPTVEQEGEIDYGAPMFRGGVAE